MLASQGKLNIVLVIVIGAASAIIGDNIGYLLGRTLGREVLGAPGPFHKRRMMVIAAGDRFFERHGPKAVFFARWIALVRFAAAWLAGINHMRCRDVLLLERAGRHHVGDHVRAGRLLRRAAQARRSLTEIRRGRRDRVLRRR